MHNTRGNSTPSRPSGRQETQAGQQEAHGKHDRPSDTWTEDATALDTAPAADAKSQNTNRPMSLTTIEGVVTLMKSARSDQEWNDNCDKVKQANNGYPAWWFQEIVRSGIYDAMKMQ